MSLVHKGPAKRRIRKTKRRSNTRTDVRLVASESKIRYLDRLPPSLVEDQEVARLDVATAAAGQRLCVKGACLVILTE